MFARTIHIKSVLILKLIREIARFTSVLRKNVK
ncbi:hypothetical protein V6Z12_A13G150100 [Gossypium hirsutum]